MAESDYINNIPKDKGWAWVVLAGAFMSFFIIAGGVIKSFGMLFDDLQTEFNTDATSISMLSSIVISIMQFTGAPANLLSNRYGPRRVMMLGGVIATAGFVTSSFAPNISWMYITFSILVGIGMGCVLCPSLLTVSLYFEKRRSLAVGLSAAGSGFASTLLPSLIRWCLDTYGLRGTLLLLGGITLQMCLIGAVMRPASYYSFEVTKRQSSGRVGANNESGRGKTTGDDDDDECSPIRSDFDYEQKSELTYLPDDLKFSKKPSIRDPKLILITACISVSSSVYMNAFVIVPPHLQQLPRHIAVTTVISSMGMADILARIVVGWIADLKIMSVSWLFTSALLTFAMSIISVPLVSSSPIAVLLFCAIFACSGSCCISLSVPLIVEHYDIRWLAVAFSYTVFGVGSTVIVIPYITGGLRDVTGNWNCSFYASGLMLSLVSVLCYCLTLSSTFDPEVNDRQDNKLPSIEVRIE